MLTIPAMSAALHLLCTCKAVALVCVYDNVCVCWAERHDIIHLHVVADVAAGRHDLTHHAKPDNLACWPRQRPGSGTALVAHFSLQAAGDSPVAGDE